MARLVIDLAQDESAGLVSMASVEMRDPHEQLRFLLRRELSRRGFLGSGKGVASRRRSPRERIRTPQPPRKVEL